MLQEAAKTINSAFNNSFIKKLSQYLHDCVREEVKSSTFRNLKADKDNKWIFLPGEEKLFTTGDEYLKLDGSDSKLTELMNQSNLGAKDKYLIYGYMFLVGKNGKRKGFNDIELLKAGGIAVAMGNGTDELKKYADFVTDTVENDGFVKAVEKYIGVKNA